MGLACVVATVSSFSASAQSCATLDYAELQDMSVPELVKEMCDVTKVANDKTYEGLNITLRSNGSDADSAAKQILYTSVDQCRNQAERMRKILVRKGVEESYSTYKILCSPK